MSYSTIGGLIIIFLAVGVLIYANSDWPTYTQQKARAAKYSYWNKKIERPYGSQFYGSNNEKNRHEHEHREDEKKFWVASKSLSAVTIVIALVASVFAGGAYLASSEQADIAKDTERKQLSAYIGPVTRTFVLHCSICGENRESTGQRDFFTYKIKNFGITPGRQIQNCGHLVYISKGLPGDAFKETILNCEKMQSFLEARAYATLWPSDSRDEIVWAEDDRRLPSILQDKNISVYFFNVTYYKDIFGLLHHTYICRHIHIFTITAIAYDGCNADAFVGAEDD